MVGGEMASAMAGMQAGKVTVENNNLSAVARLGVTACAEVATCRNMVVEKGLGALLGIGAAKTALDNLSSSERDYVFSVAMSGKADLIERLTPEQRAAYNYMVGQDQKGLITVFPKPDRELTDSKLINPGHSDQQGLVNTGNNQPLASGPTHTGNSDGLVNTGGTSTVTPLPDGPSKDDLAYLSEGSNKYIPSPKHASGGWGTKMDLSDTKAQEVIDNSIQGGKQRYGMSDGKLYEFQPDNAGGWHGYPIPGNEAPPKVLRELLSQGNISKADYNKMIKGK
ncbi:VENN motif pre-toxin domain-containing protein [Rosenbergiella nectarea]|uniref:VENN motif pre-toxin domain-containing protein n=1 Tax=Rosenbergiella nectarea TaxID=988801 RepID=UPI0022A844F1|nr:VENN motif pre-toxin domain-containing protein [Rosenbergiella nectarea]